MVSKKLAVLAALSLVVSSNVAVAQSAQSLSLAKSSAAPRAATKAGNSNIHGSTAIVAILALVAVIGGTIIATKGKSHPDSP